MAIIRRIIFWCCLMVSGAGQAESTELVLMQSLWGHQEFMKELETRFNSYHKDIKLKIEYHDIHKNNLFENQILRSPIAILMPSDKLGKNQNKFMPLSQNWVPLAIKPEVLEPVKIEDKLFGVPVISGNHLVMFYNKALVAEPAQNWQTLLAQAENLKSQGITPLGFPVESPYYLISFLNALGGGLFDETGKPHMLTEENLQALSFYKSLLDRGILLQGCDWDCGKADFHQEKVAYSIDIDGAVLASVDALGDKFGIATLPNWHDNTMAGFHNSIAIFVPQQTMDYENQKAIKRLIDFFTSMEVQTLFATERYLMPVHYGVRKALREHEDPIVQTLLEQLSRSVPAPHHIDMHNIWMSLGSNLPKFLSDDISAEELLADAQKAAEH